ncbi:MAG: glycosyl hydrolase-related protein [Blautia sp.]
MPAKAVSSAAETVWNSCPWTSATLCETVKKAEDGDGIIVRLYEVENARTKVTLYCADAILSAGKPICWSTGRECHRCEENEISLTIKPYEIRTIRIARQNKKSEQKMLPGAQNQCVPGKKHKKTPDPK